MLVVLAMLAGVAALVVTAADGVSDQAPATATEATLRALRDAALGTGPDLPGFRGDVGRPPRQVPDLFEAPAGVAAWDVVARTGWRGPYARATTRAYAAAPATGFTSVYAADGAPVPLDAWGRPVVLQVPDADGDGTPTDDDRRHARLVSAGPDGVLATPRRDADATPPGDARLPTRASCGDDLVLYLHVADTRAP